MGAGQGTGIINRLGNLQRLLRLCDGAVDFPAPLVDQAGDQPQLHRLRRRSSRQDIQAARHPLQGQRELTVIFIAARQPAATARLGVAILGCVRERLRLLQMFTGRPR